MLSRGAKRMLGRDTVGTAKDRVAAGRTQGPSGGHNPPVRGQGILCVPSSCSRGCSVPVPGVLCPPDGAVPAGRGLKSHAYIHSVQLSHHVFLNLHTLKFYCLPDNYEIIDSSLEDITVRGGSGGTPALGGTCGVPSSGGLSLDLLWC